MVSLQIAKSWQYADVNCVLRLDKSRVGTPKTAIQWDLPNILRLFFLASRPDREAATVLIESAIYLKLVVTSARLANCCCCLSESVSRSRNKLGFNDL